MKKLISAIIFSLFLSANIVLADGYIADNATVTKVSSTSFKKEAFWVYYEGSTITLCDIENQPAGTGKVKLVLSNTGDAMSINTFSRAFSLASTALVSGKKISIYSYHTADCDDTVGSITLLK